MTAKSVDATADRESTDPELQQILAYLDEQGDTVGMPIASTREVAEEIDASMPHARRQLFKLEGRGMLARKEAGQFLWYLPRPGNHPH